MPRVLKTLYPCRHCGVPARVGRRSEAEHACCPLCATLGSYCGFAAWHDRRGDEEFKKQNESTEDPFLLVVRLAPVLEHFCQAAADGLMAARLTLRDPRARASWIRWSHARLEWVEDCSKQLRELTEGLRVGFTMITGGFGPAPEDAP